MKALAYDVERNLRTPLAGIAAQARLLGRSPVLPVVGTRTGDTSAKDRRRFLRHGADVLVTTPESLYLLLSSRSRERLATVETVIVDEIHAVAGTKRGVHLALSLERLAELVTRADGALEAGGGPRPRRPSPQRIGLSATQRPLDEIAAFLGGRDQQGQRRPVSIVDCSAAPSVDLRVVVPVDDMLNPSRSLPDPPPVGGPVADRHLDPVRDDLPVGPAQGSGQGSAQNSLSIDKQGMWPAIHPQLLELVQHHRSTIIFTNSRRLCERLALRLNELALEGGLTQPWCVPTTAA